MGIIGSIRTKIRKMMRSWMQRRLSRSVKSDFLELLVMLRSFSNRQLGVILIYATHTRLKWQDEWGEKSKVLFLDPHEIPYPTLLFLTRDVAELMTKQHHEGDSLDSLGIRIWFYTIMGVTFPEHKKYSRAIWKELEQGRACVEELYYSLSASGLHLHNNILKEYQHIPKGFK